MRGHAAVLLVLALALSAPIAAADDPLNKPVCVPDLCVGVGTCIEVACTPRGCEPAVSCRSDITLLSTACAFNVTIDGRTCALHAGFALGAPGGAMLAADAGSSNGSVRASHLWNTWSSPGADASAGAGGVDAGRVFVYGYRSEILTEGPRGGPLGRVEPHDNHTWTEIGLVAGTEGGPAGGADAVVALKLLDGMPEGCYARSYMDAVPETRCPRLPIYLP